MCARILLLFTHPTNKISFLPNPSISDIKYLSFYFLSTTPQLRKKNFTLGKTRIIKGGVKEWFTLKQNLINLSYDDIYSLVSSLFNMCTYR